MERGIEFYVMLAAVAGRCSDMALQERQPDLANGAQVTPILQGNMPEPEIDAR